MSQNAKQNTNINAELAMLREQIDWFYSDNFDLEKAVGNYEKATKLAKKIESDLATLKNRIEVIAQDFTQS